LREAQVDLVLSMLSPDAENLRVADFSAPYYELGGAVMQRKGDAAIREARDLPGRKLGLIARNEGRPALLDGDVAGTPASISFFDSFTAAAAALERKEIDGLFSEAVNIDIWLAGQQGRFERSPTLTREPVAVAVGKGNPTLLDEVNALIGELRASGRLEALAREHGLPPATAGQSFSPPLPPPP
jgi:ABC-type amino acid transport substrate-binding protein